MRVALDWPGRHPANVNWRICLRIVLVVSTPDFGTAARASAARFAFVGSESPCLNVPSCRVVYSMRPYLSLLSPVNVGSWFLFLRGEEE